MPLSRLANELAAEIAQQDWSDAPYRADRAGHRREYDSKAPAEVLDRNETDCVRMNAMWVVAQVLGHADPNFDVVEFASACGVQERRPGILQAGLRRSNGVYATPGTFDYPTDGSAQQPPLRLARPASPAPAEEHKPTERYNLRVSVDLDGAPTWGDLRRFVAVVSTPPDSQPIGLEYDDEHDRRALYGYIG